MLSNNKEHDPMKKINENEMLHNVCAITYTSVTTCN